MSLFQKSVIKKYISEQDKCFVDNQFNVFKKYFQNTTIQKNIIASKEEEFQEGFLRELFVNVFGYTINPEPNYNLVTELKNEKDSKKADGAILKNENAIAVIELKSTTTTDLNKIEIQAFNYKNNQQDCKYVITSNFQKLRFYIDNAIEFLEWDLFKIDSENFKLLYLCLCKENLLNDLPSTIKKESLIEEENITKRLYKEYSSFRKSLFGSIIELNPSTNKLLLFKKTQKLLDRFLFLFFAEDRMLVPPNSVRLILEQWNSLKDMDAYVALYDRFKLYFGYLNTGHKGKLHEIFAYNGGLFATDEVLDNIKIDDEILYNATLSLSRYDYNSDVDVNILGHIFEHSLTEIEELENEIEQGATTDKKATKRKKDGVFYTPKYITKYIIENTIGTLCKNKKDELRLQEEDYHTLTKKEKKKLYTTLLEYKSWLLQITIVDPACGSGAFLNQALEFLIAEHKWISELEASITGSTIIFDIENSILENNLFGVDINEESVEIAKLSLWLRTAQKGRKLNSLNNNIKCGNSLIDDISVAGDKAFNWHKEFPQVFGEYIGLDKVEEKKVLKQISNNEKAKEVNYTNESESTNQEKNYLNIDNRITNNDFNIVNETLIDYNEKPIIGKGFDVVIGNPPYVRRTDLPENLKIGLEKKYVSAFKQYDLYILFNELAVVISKQNGLIGFIQPNKFLSADYGLKINNFLSENIHVNSIYNVSADKVFSDASVYPYIFIFQKKDRIYNSQDSKISLLELCKKENLIGFDYLQNSNSIIQKIKAKSIRIIDIADRVRRGLPNSKLIFNEFGKHFGIKSTLLEYPYFLPISKTRFDFLQENTHEVPDEDFILLPRTVLKIRAIKNSRKYDVLDRIYYFKIKDSEYFQDFILALLNSKLISFYYDIVYGSTKIGGGYIDLKGSQIENFPVCKIENLKQQKFSTLITLIETKIETFDNLNKTFLQLLSSKFKNMYINTKLEKWYDLSFADFSKELSKQKIKLSLQQESEWLQYFELEKQKAQTIKTELETTDNQINIMIYELYDLTVDEIAIVEAGIK